MFFRLANSRKEFSGEAGVWGSAPPPLPSPAPARSGPPAYTGFPITKVLPVCWVPRDRHDRPTQEGAAVKGTVEYRSPSGEDMPRKPLDSCKAARPLAVPPVLLLGIPLVLRAINEHKNNRPSLETLAVTFANR